MVSPEVIRKRLDKLDDYLAFLETARQYTQNEFLENPERYGSAERFLQLSIEALIDLAGHVVAEEGLGPVEQSSDLPAIFAEQEWIDDEVEEKWTRMIGFRNVLVHDYLDINRDLVYEVVQNNLDDLRQLRTVFARFL